MKILVINSGSSSIKYRLTEMPQGKVLSRGMVERIGLDGTVLHHEAGGKKIIEPLPAGGHKEALQIIAEKLETVQGGAGIVAVGHRVVHGGSRFDSTVRISRRVKQQIRSLFSLAPLHNPANLTGIELAEKFFPGAVQVAVFDTAFHRDIPPVAHRYALPAEYYDKYHIRVYGFHGTSHKYVTELVRKRDPGHSGKLISIHLGNGCSMTAVLEGKSIDHSLGFGPLNGLIMGTRSGDIDPAVLLYLMERHGYSAGELSELLQKKSGLLGLTGSRDMREVEAAAIAGDDNAALAIDMVAYRIRKYIGSYAAAMNGLDALIFTAGIGENSAMIRKASCMDMDFFGIRLDGEKNQAYRGGIDTVEAAGSKVKIWVVPTDEEYEITRQTYALVQSQ